MKKRSGLSASRALAIVASIATLLSVVGVSEAPAKAKAKPTTAAQCKKNGWKKYGFKNQGTCVSYVNGQNKKKTTATTAKKTTATTAASKVPADADLDGVLRYGVDILANGGVKFDTTTTGPGGYIQTLPVIRPLMKRDEAGYPQPDLAQSARVVDPTTVEVILRPNLKFSDGTDLNAAAVKATFERNLASNNTAGLLIPDMQRVSRLIVESPTKLTIKLAKPGAGIVYMLLAGVEFAPMSPKSFTDGTNLNTHAVGAGPMRVVSYTAGQRIVFEKNPYYWDAEHVYLKGMEWVHTTVGSAVINGLRSGQLDAAQIDPDQAQNMQGDLTASLDRTNSAMTIVWCIKDGTPLGNLKVRQAVNHAIDRDTYNGIIYDGRSATAWDFFPSSNKFHNKSLDDLYPRNVARAKQLLTEAGYPNGFKFSMAVGPGISQISAEVVQSQLRDAGIDMSVTVSNNASLDYQAGRADSFVVQSRPGPFDKVSRFYLSDSGSGNACRYPVPQVDTLFNKAAGYGLDDPAAAPVWHQLSETVFKDLAMFPQLTFRIHSMGYNKKNVGKMVFYWNQLGDRSVDPAGTYMRK